MDKMTIIPQNKYPEILIYTLPSKNHGLELRIKSNISEKELGGLYVREVSNKTWELIDEIVYRHFLNEIREDKLKKLLK